MEHSERLSVLWRCGGGIDGLFGVTKHPGVHGFKLQSRFENTGSFLIQFLPAEFDSFFQKLRHGLSLNGPRAGHGQVRSDYASHHLLSAASLHTILLNG